MPEKMNKGSIEKYFKALNDKLSRNGENAELLICGGASMAMLYDNETLTKDIDGMILSQNIKPDLLNYINQIAEEYELENDWFNEGAKGYINQNWEKDSVMEFPNLKIYSVKAEQLLAMKLSAARFDSRDMEDAVKLMKHLDIKNVDDALDILERNIYNGLLTAKVENFTREVFELKKSQEIDIEPIKTVIVNAFGGPGAGKTTAAWEMAFELKKQGFCVEYVSEYAKELVWEENFELLDGSIEHQEILLNEQKHRLDRLIGKADIVITDAPILLNVQYCNDCPKEYEEKVLNYFNSYSNFNFFIERGSTFEERGRIHNLEESVQKDIEIKNFLEEHDIYYGKYNHERVEVLSRNIARHYRTLYKSSEANILMNKEDNMAGKEKVYININKKYVEKGFQEKRPDGTYREYNKVTIPSKTVIDGKNIGGYTFYPLYINQSRFHENVVGLPMLKDREIQLHKNGETIKVTPEKLSEAIKEGFEQWKAEKNKDKDLEDKTEKEESIDKEFDWQGKPFKNYVREYIAEGLESIEDKSVQADNIQDKIMEYDERQGIMLQGGDYEAKCFIKEYFWEAVDTQEFFADYGVETFNPFTDSEKFSMQMVSKGVSDMLSESEFVKEKEGEKIMLNRKAIERIKKDIGFDAGTGKSLGKEKDVDMELD